MRKPKGYQCHQCAPREWRNVPNMTGDYDLDSTILHRRNRDLPNRIQLYIRKNKQPYGGLTGYNALAGYHGDN